MHADCKKDTFQWRHLLRVAFLKRLRPDCKKNEFSLVCQLFLFQNLHAEEIKSILIEKKKDPSNYCANICCLKFAGHRYGGRVSHLSLR